MTKTYRVVWRQTATDDLYRLYHWIADRTDPDTAFDYTSAIEAHAAALAAYPNRGTPRDDIARGVRTLNFRGRTVIAYRVGEAVEVLRIFHAGQELGWAE